MAFQQANLECLNTTGFMSLWHYRSTVDTLAVIRGSGYFNGPANASAGSMNTGDVMFIGPDSAGAGGISMVTNTSGVITLGTGSPMLAEAEAKEAAKAGEKAAAAAVAPPPQTVAHENQKAAPHR